jgi:pimeloyl-ACP methyl ester carboxylesterase/DNA-binding CsgD family transcriptional regulator
VNPSARPTQEIHLLTAQDGVRLAYARTGSGPALVRPAHWLSHLELDWENSVWCEFLTELARDRTLIRYDERGTGLSDRNVADISFEAMVSDLEAVVDEAGLERFALLGMSQGAAIGIAYAVRHPERVTALVLCGGYARGHHHRTRTPEQRRDAELLLELIRVGWGTPNPKFRRVFATMFLPSATPEQYADFDALQRGSATPEMAYRLREMFSGIDVTALCSRVRAPTLVMHVRDDAVVPFDEGRLLAALIPGSRFVPLEGSGHLLVPGSPAWGRFFSELRTFLDQTGETIESTAWAAEGRRQRDVGVDALSTREREIMGLVAEGHTNGEIADALVLSPRTIERHLSNVYAKLGVEGKAARAAAAARVARSGGR